MRLIDADKLIKQWESYFYDDAAYMTYSGDVIVQTIRDAETVEGIDKEVQAHWIADKREKNQAYATNACSNCGFVTYAQTPYCPECGAKMVRPWDNI